MSRRHDEYMVALDLGSSTARAAVACWRADGELVLEGYAEAPSRGVARGIIVDLPAAAEAIRQAVEGAANLARVKVCTLFAAAATPFARGFNSRGCIGIPHEDKLVRGPDAAAALAAANRVSLPADRTIAEVYSQGFTLDDVRGIRNPVGMACGRLEAEQHVVSDSASALANLRQAVRKAGYHLEAPIYAPLAAAEAVIEPEEKRLGAAHIDIGAEKTAVSVYERGYPRYTRIIPVGARHIARDLAIGLNIRLADAENVQRTCGIPEARRPRANGAAEKIEVPSPDGGSQLIPLWRVAAIVRARAEEILELAGKELDRSGCAAAAAKAVLTGGFCRIPEALATAHRVLRRPVRIGIVELETILPQFAPDPTQAVVFGTLERGVCHRERRFDRRFAEPRFRALLRRVATWL